MNNFQKLLDWAKDSGIDTEPEGIKLTPENIDKYLSCQSDGVDPELTKLLVNSSMSLPTVSHIAKLHKQGLPVDQLVKGDFNSKQVTELGFILALNENTKKLDDSNRQLVDIEKLLNPKLSPVQIKFAGMMMAKGINPDEILSQQLTDDQVEKLSKAILQPSNQDVMQSEVSKDVDKQVREILKFGATGLTTGDSQKISTLIDSVHEVKAVALPDGNVMLNQSAKVAISDFIGLESARHNVMSDWNGQTDNQLKSELGAKANVLLGELQKSAELNKAKLNEALPVKLSFREQSQFKGQGNNLQNIYENLTHKGSNVISMNDYKQIVNQMNNRAQSANLSQALTMSKGVKR